MFFSLDIATGLGEGKLKAVKFRLELILCRIFLVRRGWNANIYICVCVCVCVCVTTSQKHGFPWPSHATNLYRPSLPAGIRGYILYQYRAVVDRFYRVSQLLIVRVKGFTGVHRLWVPPYFSKSLLHVLFIYIYIYIYISKKAKIIITITVLDINVELIKIWRKLFFPTHVFPPRIWGWGTLKFYCSEIYVGKTIIFIYKTKKAVHIIIFWTNISKMISLWK